MTLLLKTLQHHQATLPSIFFSFKRKVGSKDFFFILDENHLEKCQLESWNGIFIILPSDGQGLGGGGEATPLKVFLSFLLEDKTSAPDDSW